MAFFLLKAENDSRKNLMEEMCRRAQRSFLGRLDPLLPERLVLEQRLADILQIARQQVSKPQTAGLKSERARRQNLNRIIEAFGLQINRYDPAFIDYVENFGLYNPQVRLGINNNEAIDCIFTAEKQAAHCDHTSISGKTPICPACELLRFKTVMACPNASIREGRRQEMENTWISRLAGESPQRTGLPMR